MKKLIMSGKWNILINIKACRKVKSTTCNTSLPGAPDGEYVVIRLETSFEYKKSAIETVRPMLEKDGRRRVSGYYIK